MTLTTTQFIIAIVIALALAGVLAYLFINQRKSLKKAAGPKPAAPADGPLVADSSTRQLQLAAYERLILLTDRIALPNVIQRLNQPELSARELQSLLTLGIRQEFEHNITQQIYVSPEAWDAVRNYKEQNILIINQVASFTPPEAAGIELAKNILDILVQNPQASLQNIVSDVLSFEAKKLM